MVALVVNGQLVQVFSMQAAVAVVVTQIVELVAVA
jgi:hypothetical protein